MNDLERGAVEYVSSKTGIKYTAAEKFMREHGLEYTKVAQCLGAGNLTPKHIINGIFGTDKDVNIIREIIASGPKNIKKRDKLFDFLIGSE